jgi:hypothetical protein
MQVKATMPLTLMVNGFSAILSAPILIIKKMKVERIDKKDLDINGSGEVNYTHKNMTIIVDKINELIDEYSRTDALTERLIAIHNHRSAQALQ